MNRRQEIALLFIVVAFVVTWMFPPWVMTSYSMSAARIKFRCFAITATILQQPDHLIQAPNVISDVRFHRWRHTQGLVIPAKIVVHVNGRAAAGGLCPP
jgi:hypothetical protein